jgi:hypothetical protein
MVRTKKKMSKPHYDVLIATPGNSLEPAYVESLVQTTEWLNSKGLTYKWLNKSSSFVPSARELTATNTYVHDYETKEIGSGEFTYGVIFWIDSDISWDVEDFVRIYESDKEVISGLYQTHPNGTVALALEDEEGMPRKVLGVEFLLHEEPSEVWAVGFGFVAMKSGVFESIERPWFLIERIKWPSVEFETNIGEDYSWCIRAKKAGYKIWVDPAVKVWHHKDTIYEVR